MTNMEQLVEQVLDMLMGGTKYVRTQQVEAIMAKYLHPEQAKMGWGATAVTWPRENILDHGNNEHAEQFPDSPVWLEMMSRSQYLYAGLLHGDPESEVLAEVQQIEEWISEHSLPFHGYSMFRIEEPPVTKVSTWACWPIPRTIFDQAQAVDFIPDRFNADVQYHLMIAKVAYRSHRTLNLPKLQAEIDKAGLKVRA